MTRQFFIRLATSLAAVACASTVAASLWTIARDARAGDRNGDGQPDIWRSYDWQGRISQLTIDTNFDGRSDVREYYERGALVRRESDRDFNDRVDLVQRFDVSTREHASSVVDVDFDGAADLLVLFQNGRPVYSKWAHGTRPGSAQLTRAAYPRPPSHPTAERWDALDNPFSGDLAVGAVGLTADTDGAVGLSTAGGLPSDVAALASPLATPAYVSFAGTAIAPSTSVLPRSPRGPPPSHLL